MRMNNIYGILLGLLVPSVLLSFAGNSIVLALLSVMALMRIKLRDLRPYAKKYIIFNAFSLTIFIGFILDLIHQETVDPNQLIRRLSLILLPLIIIASSRKEQKLALSTYVYFVSAASTLIVGLGFYRALKNRGNIIYGNWNSELTESFYQEDMLLNWGELTYKRLFLGLDMHPSYYALASVMVISLLLFYRGLSISKNLKILLITLHVLTITLISSKAGILSLLPIGLTLLVSLPSTRQKAIFSISASVLCLTLISIPSTQLRIKNAIRSVTTISSGESLSSTSERMELWESMKNHQVKDLLIGQGNEGAKKVIVKETGISKNLHNQFLQALLSSGILGLILLLLFTFSPLLYERNLLTLNTVIVVFLNLFFENMLDRIWGISIIGFFYALFLFGKIDWDKDKNGKRITDSDTSLS